MDQRDFRCLELSLALVDKVAHDKSLRIFMVFWIKLEIAQLTASCHIDWLDSTKVASCVSLNPGVIITRIVSFYGLVVTIDLLSLLLTENFRGWADF